MPKDRRQRISQAHQSSAKIASRSFAVLEGETEKLVLSTEVLNAPANDLLRSVPTLPTVKPSATAPTQTKKEKKQLKHELFLQRLTAGTSPYSKSHNRRLKRKAKSGLSADFASVEKALRTLVPEVSTTAPKHEPTSQPAKATALMGEGKGVTLSKKQRQKALELERLRQSAIMQNPEFKSNPFAAIRTHTQNSLLPHGNTENKS
ncbi:hypothetical protein FRC07_005196 [Ceratobasidium sp. 392]|nr:hypothetical protein FRC07_005196 [Ceratobasidium sp. 392]